jgi:hypothetical protein
VVDNTFFRYQLPPTKLGADIVIIHSLTTSTEAVILWWCHVPPQEFINSKDVK